MANPNNIILCLESQDDWTNCMTRSLVMQVNHPLCYTYSA